MTSNRLVIFSNGIADFQRTYNVTSEKPATITLSVKEHHLADVLSSWNLFGEVQLVAPPTYRPSNAADGHLTIDSSNVLHQLAERLSGAEVEVLTGQKQLRGILMGLTGQDVATGGEKIQIQSLVLQTDDKLVRVPLKELESLHFCDESVRSEIDKALRRNFQTIKPESTLIDLSVTTQHKVTEAVLQYTIPAAAWKICYRLRRTVKSRIENDSPKDREENSANHYELQGFAVVDNNTEEDWNDFDITFVTGEPFTFSTDLADSKIPGRNHVDIVRDHVFGGMEVEQGMGMMDDSILYGAISAAPESAVALEAADALREETRGRSMAKRRAAPRGATGGFAKMQSAVQKEIGDFCLYESQSPVSIAANRSAVVPVFQTTLENSEIILHYDADQHSERAFRAILFRNTTGQSLGRGVCTIYEENTYAGSCVLPAIKPDGEALLPHAMETGVLLRRTFKEFVRQLSSLHISDGVVITTERNQQDVHYQLQNQKDVPFEVYLDHRRILDKSHIKTGLHTGKKRETELNVHETLQDGVRYRFRLAAKQEVAVIVTETKVATSRRKLFTKKEIAKAEEHARWLIAHLVESNTPLAKHEELQQVIGLQQKIDSHVEQIQQQQVRIEQLSTRQNRLRENIKAGGMDDQTNRWRVDLGQAEDEITKIEDEVIPKLHDDRNDLLKRQQELLLSLAMKWEAEE